MIQFWTNDPSILLNKDYVSELWPSPKMKYEQKLNAISRLIILLTLLGFLFTASLKILFIGFITIASIYFLYTMKDGKKVTKETFKSREDSTSATVTKNSQNPEPLEKFLKTDFEKNTKKNPFGNVLLTDIGDKPKRKAAPPAFNPDVYEDITKSVKGMVQNLNPGIKNTNKQIFGDLGENFNLDLANRNFYSTANTRVGNDQGAFADYLYGDMPSGKDSGIEGALQRVKDNYRYTLY